MDSKIRRRMQFLKPLCWLRAFVGGYFWLPCPICEESFGGFEWGARLCTIHGLPAKGYALLAQKRQRGEIILGGQQLVRPSRLLSDRVFE